MQEQHQNPDQNRNAHLNVYRHKKRNPFRHASHEPKDLDDQLKSQSTGARHAVKVLARSMIGSAMKRHFKSAQKFMSVVCAINTTTLIKTSFSTTRRAIDARRALQMSMSRKRSGVEYRERAGDVDFACDLTRTGQKGASISLGILKRASHWQAGSMRKSFSHCFSNRMFARRGVISSKKNKNLSRTLDGIRRIRDELRDIQTAVGVLNYRICSNFSPPIRMSPLWCN